MVSANTFGITFFLKKDKARKNQLNPDVTLAPVYARITVDKNSCDTSLKTLVNVNDWHEGRGLAIGKTNEQKKINTFLEQIRSRFVECYRELQLDRKLITAEAVKMLYLGVEEKEHTLIGIFEYHNAEMKRELERGTQKNYYTTKRYVENFLKDKHRTTDIYLSHLNYKFITDFEKYVKENPLDEKNPCNQNGTMKHIERLRKVVNLAIKNDWLIKDPFQKFSPRFIKNDREFLVDEELEIIETKELNTGMLQVVRDLFVFSCYTGLAYADAMRLSPVHLRIGIDRDFWLFIPRKKNLHVTEENVKIPLLPKAYAIIKKYQNNPDIVSSGRLLPGMSNQVLNRNLKSLAAACEINKDLTFHMARHTFATTVTLTNGVPMETVSKVLGHSSIRTTQIYAKVIEKKVSEDMSLLKAKLSSNNTKKLPKAL